MPRSIWLWVSVALACCVLSSAFIAVPGNPLLQVLQRPSGNKWLPLKMKDDGHEEQAMEAMRSIGDFHEGSWAGKSTSFTVSDDTAAGIIQKKISSEYKIDVKLAYAQNDLAISETFSWKDQDQQPVKSSRNLSFSNSNIDVDTVDASYSADSSLPDIPAVITGTDKFIQFAVEQCIAVSDDERVRLFALYQDKLVRVVVCEEKRMPEQPVDISSAETSAADKLSASDLMEMQNDVDRLVDKIAGQVEGNTFDPKSISGSSLLSGDSSGDRMNRLQAALSDGSATSKKRQGGDSDRGPPLYRHSMSLLDLTSGVWLGDSIIRHFPSVPSSREKVSGKGFGNTPDRSSTRESGKIGAFGAWEIGVQKVSRQWLWDFGEEIRQENDAGKAMGAEMEPELGKTMSGAVCGKESFSRRIPKEERIVYIDWNNGNGGDHVGFILGSVSIQVPRYLTFGQSSGGKRSKPFLTELCVYQSDTDGKTVSDNMKLNTDLSSEEVVEKLPEICCSRICRIYNTQGQLRQGCTSFYSLKRYGTELDNEDDE